MIYPHKGGLRLVVELKVHLIQNHGQSKSVVFLMVKLSLLVLQKEIENEQN